MKKLLIVRHSKSSWSDPYLSDFDNVVVEMNSQEVPLEEKVILPKD